MLKGYWYYGIALVIFLCFIGFGLFYREESGDLVVDDVDLIEELSYIDEKKIKVDIKGAVSVPGVYELDEGSRIEDLIEKSGGVIEGASLNQINLSKRLEDEMVVIIYTDDEIEAMKKREMEGNVVIEECICPIVENSGCMEDRVTNVLEEKKDVNSDKISLNRASVEELTTLSGIGISKAEAIIEYRESNGGFKSIDEILNVKGIGEAVYEKIKDQLAL